MQWRRQKKITHVIGSSNHVLLLARYQDGTERTQRRNCAWSTRRPLFSLEPSLDIENMRISKTGQRENILILH